MWERKEERQKRVITKDVVFKTGRQDRRERRKSERKINKIKTK